MLTHSEETDSDESSRAADDTRPAVAGDEDTSVHSDPPDEPWAIVSLGGHLEDTAIANNLSGLDLNSINQESGVSSLSGTNGIALDGQTILSSLGPDVDEDDDAIAIDGLLLPGPNPDGSGSVTVENDDLSIPDTVPSNIRSIRGIVAANTMASPQPAQTDQQKQNRKRDTIVLVCFAVLFLGLTVLASTWRRSALRLETELAALRNLKQEEGRKTNVAIFTTGAQPKAPPLFGGGEEQKEATPFTVADNCYIKAKASVSLGSCGSELKNNLQNASSRIRKGLQSFSRKFEEAASWTFGNDDGGNDSNSTGTFFSSPSFFSGPKNTASDTSQEFSSFTNFWKAKRNHWNKASKRFASDITAAANRASANVHQKLNQSNKAIEHGILSLIDHARDAIEESTNTLRVFKLDKGVGVYSPYTGNGANFIEGFRTIFSNITSVRLIAQELSSMGGTK